MTGTISVLNAGAGDMKFSFNSDDPLEVARAQRCVEDMLRRGYMLFVETGGKLHRVEGFDPARCEYIVADGPGSDSAAEPKKPEPKKPEPKPRKGRRRVAAKGSKATGVPKTAGG